MKWFFLVPLCALLLLSNACQKHPVSDLSLLDASNSEGVQPEPKRDAPQLQTTKPAQTDSSK